MRTDELDYHLPEECIAATPVEPRDAARLLVHCRCDGSIAHRHVRDLPELLHPGDLLVFNVSSVLRARLALRRAAGGMIEGLALAPAVEVCENHSGTPDAWRVLLRGSARLRGGERLTVLDRDDVATAAAIELIRRDGEGWLVGAIGEEGEVSGLGPSSTVTSSSVTMFTATIRFEHLLQRFGRVPLPPYIRRARTERGAAVDDARDPVWYETVFADPSQRRSVAAPTAGLHFTPELLDRLRRRGVERVDLMLDVGPGTFKPVGTETLEAHPMHREHFAVPAGSLMALRRARAEGRRIIAVGTTSARTLESIPAISTMGESDGSNLTNADAGIAGATGLLIAPGHRWRNVDALITNFHLPRSTLLALVGAMVGMERLREIYAEAIHEGYRFYSYGDAMLIH